MRFLATAILITSFAAGVPARVEQKIVESACAQTVEMNTNRPAYPKKSAETREGWTQRKKFLASSGKLGSAVVYSIP